MRFSRFLEQLIVCQLHMSHAEEALYVFGSERHTTSFSRYKTLHRALERDGFTVEDGTLRRTLPQAFDLPAANDEVHLLLNRYNFATSRGHLDQAITAHARGDGQQRTANVGRSSRASLTRLPSI